MPGLLAENCTEAHKIEQLAVSKLSERLALQKDCSTREIQRVSGLTRKVFPAEIELDKENSERIRALCALSQTRLDLDRQISSHRPILGKLIVTLKRFIWRFIKPQLDEAFDSIQEYNSWLIYSHAELISRLDHLESRSKAPTVGP